MGGVLSLSPAETPQGVLATLELPTLRAINSRARLFGAGGAAPPRPQSPRPAQGIGSERYAIRLAARIRAGAERAGAGIAEDDLHAAEAGGPAGAGPHIVTALA